MPTTDSHEPILDPGIIAILRTQLPDVAAGAVTAIIAEVPTYAGAFQGPMGETIRNAVQLALGGFLTLATRDQSGSPLAPAIEGAYRLGRGEAKSGRSAEALLAAYRVGARVCWRDLSRAAVDGGIASAQLATFAELVFAYIDQLSAASVAGHTDELESSGRLRQRNLERLARALLTGVSADNCREAAERAEWETPEALTAVLLADSLVSHVLSLIDARTLVWADDLPGLTEGIAVLLVPSGRTRAARATLLRTLRGNRAVIGPSVAWLDAATSFQRAHRCLELDLDGLVDSEEHLARLVLDADPAARADLRERVLAPLADLRSSTAEKLVETLRSWLLHQGRRDAVAADLFVHPQTVRYRVGQLRDVYGDLLEDPAFVREAVVALA